MVINSSKQNRIFGYIISAIIGFSVCAVLTLCGYVIKEFYKGKLRVGYPLLVYKCEYIEEFQGRKVGLFGIIETFPQWLYQVSFANLSRKTIHNIDFSVELGLKCNAIYINPIGCQFFGEPKKPLPVNSFTLLGNNTEHINFLGNELISGRSATCFLIIISRERPSISNIKITINCPTGTFEKITSTQWEEIGWQKVKN